MLNEDDPIKKIINKHGINFSIEWKKGEVRQYKSGDFKRLMKVDYGYVADTLTEDGEGIDVYIGDYPSEIVYKITQLKSNKEFPGVSNKEFDEYKYMVDYSSALDAEESYKYHITPEQFGGIEEMTIEDLKLFINMTIIDVSKLKDIIKEKIIMNKLYENVLAGKNEIEELFVEAKKFKYVQLGNSSYYVNKVGKDVNGNWSYWVSKGNGKSKKIQVTGNVKGEKVTDITRFQDTDKNIEKVKKSVIDYYKKYLEQTNEEVLESKNC